MGILLALCLLSLLSVNLMQATKIPPEHLAYIVKQFHQARGSGSESNNDFKQFAFLMVLNEEQCTKGISDFNPTVPQKVPEGDWKYIALKPGRATINGKREIRYCAEARMLLTDPSPAAAFGNIEAVQDTLACGGCVIFYTANTPCIGRCFGGGQLDIIGPLNNAPFDAWKTNELIDMYFVYTQPYSSNQNEEDFNKCVTESFVRLNENKSGSPYLIYRCSTNECRPCEANNNFCLEPTQF
ncbi:uncharacterized protein [Ambystoma mexicanum]|uniref:uncharacterized protein n=1 Tax=Ambystoma mexicanum TaxID=8296 RepID=UPI0037E83384